MIGPRPGSVPEKEVPKILTVCDIKYHFVWVTRYNYPFWNHPIAWWFYKEYLHEECETHGIKILGGRNHHYYISITLQCPPSISPAKIVEIMRDRAAEVLQEREERFKVVYEQYKRFYEGRPLWEEEYYCGTVGTEDEEIVQKYLAGELRDGLSEDSAEIDEEPVNEHHTDHHPR